MARSITVSRALALVAAAGLTSTASAQWGPPSFLAFDFLPDMLEMTPVDVVGSGETTVVAYRAIRERGVQNQVFDSGLWHAGEHFPMPERFDANGELYETQMTLFRQSPQRGPGDPIKGIPIVVVTKPVGQFGQGAFWDTREGVADATLNFLGVGSYDLSAAHSADLHASTIVGTGYTDLSGSVVSRRAVRWDTASGVGTEYPMSMLMVGAEARGMSANGQVTVGVAHLGFQDISFDTSVGIAWFGNGMYAIFDHLEGLTHVSGDGIAFAGIGTTRSNTKGDINRTSTGQNFTLDAGDINGDGVINVFDDHDSVINDLSFDGNVVVGSVTLPGEDERAAFWVFDGAGYNFFDLSAYLEISGVTNLEGWHLSSITAVSDDGTVFVGSGIDPLGRTAGWMVTVPVPTPGTMTLLALGGVMASRRRRPSAC
ncbi:MAG: hypothetical protein KF912_00840 [Phycisphaeraceae bacterium]|nr:hypothetical protein [Phycisphaeraceae bacterium]MBX3365844.1 hypothetical protein [Phycisphaeraceae bacterium]